MEEIKPVSFNKSKKKKNQRSFYLKILGLLLLIVVALLVSTNSTTPEVFSTIFGNGPSLQSDNNKVNILLLGMAGGNHDGSMLTDTIIVASIDQTTKKVDLISLPRDLWLTKQQAKINTLYQKGTGEQEGLAFVESEIGNILGIKIPYAIRIDFSGFTKAVDLVGGIEVNVANTFDDYLYPIEEKKNDMCGYKEEEKDLDESTAKPLNLTPGRYKVLVAPDGKIATTSAQILPGEKQKTEIVYDPDFGYKTFTCRYEHIHFDKGTKLMDGTTALKFVRSRTGNNGEGSDFARSKRQQLVLSSFKQKILSWDTLLDLSKLSSLVKTFDSSIDTDIVARDYLDFAKLAKETTEVQSHIIDFSGNMPLLTTPRSGNYGGAWVLVPTKGESDYSEIQKYVYQVLHPTPTPVISITPVLTPTKK